MRSIAVTVDQPLRARVDVPQAEFAPQSMQARKPIGREAQCVA
jgi:hypothetical protein